MFRPREDNETDEAFFKRRNFIEEDEYAGKKVMDGLPEYSEFKVKQDEGDEDDNGRQLQFNKEILRFLVMRVFRPDLIEEQISRFVELFLTDPLFTTTHIFSYHDIMAESDSTAPNLIVKDELIDAQQEL